ncbi:hypothetical protein Tco_1212595 [Tanacetum coccineum]
MQEELLQFKLQQVWKLVDLPNGMGPLEQKWFMLLNQGFKDPAFQTKFSRCMVKALYGLLKDQELYETLLFRKSFSPKMGDADDVEYRKSTTEGCQFLGNRLISWQCKKQTMVTTSITKAKYVAAASCCGQVLWIQNQLLDYGYNFMNIVINIDNNSTICIIENPIQHSKTKHIEIRHHFIRDRNAKKLIQMVKIHTDHNVADLVTKGFDAGRISTVGDEAVHKELGDRMERAATTASSLEVVVPGAKIPYWGGVVDAQTRFETTSKQSNDPPLSRVNTFGSGEDNMKLMELMAHCTKLSELGTTMPSEQLMMEEVEYNCLAVMDMSRYITESISKKTLKLEESDVSPSESRSSLFLITSTHQSHQSSPLRDITRQEAEIPQSQFPTKLSNDDRIHSQVLMLMLEGMPY